MTCIRPGYGYIRCFFGALAVSAVGLALLGYLLGIGPHMVKR